MGQFNCVGLEALEAELARRLDLVDAAAPEMLKVGTDILVEYQKGSLIEKGLIDSGDLFDSIRADPMEHGADGYFREVRPHGRDHKGVSNALKGLIHEYGTSTSDARNERMNKKYGVHRPNHNIGGSHWMEEANEAAHEEIVEAMRQVWGKFTEGKE